MSSIISNPNSAYDENKTIIGLKYNKKFNTRQIYNDENKTIIGLKLK